MSARWSCCCSSRCCVRQGTSSRATSGARGSSTPSAVTGSPSLSTTASSLLFLSSAVMMSGVGVCGPLCRTRTVGWVWPPSAEPLDLLGSLKVTLRGRSLSICTRCGPAGRAGVQERWSGAPGSVPSMRSGVCTSWLAPSPSPCSSPRHRPSGARVARLSWDRLSSLEERRPAYLAARRSFCWRLSCTSLTAMSEYSTVSATTRVR